MTVSEWFSRWPYNLWHPAKKARAGALKVDIGDILVGPIHDEHGSPWVCVFGVTGINPLQMEMLEGDAPARVEGDALERHAK